MPQRKPEDYARAIFIYLIVFFVAAIASSRLLLRGEMVTVPSLVGKPLAEARVEAIRRKTVLTVQGYQFDSRYERGRIISQDPPAQSRIKSHRKIKVTLSEGSEKVSVPKLEGRSLEWSTQLLKDAGLRRGRVSQIHSSKHAAGRVIAQQPSPAVTVGRNSAVDVLISQGAWEARYIMPDLIDKDANAILRQLRAMGFKVAEIHPSFYPGLGPGIIIRQFPLHGSKVRQRNQIALEVSK